MDRDKATQFMKMRVKLMEGNKLNIQPVAAEWNSPVCYTQTQRMIINKTSRMTNQIYRVDNTCRTIKLLLHLELLAQECRVQIRGEIGEETDSKTSNQVVEQTARKMWQ